MTGWDGSNNLNDVWKTKDLVNWTLVIADGHGQFAQRQGAAAEDQANNPAGRM